jgi:hypothetical protein
MAASRVFTSQFRQSIVEHVLKGQSVMINGLDYRGRCPEPIAWTLRSSIRTILRNQDQVRR